MNILDKTKLELASTILNMKARTLPRQILYKPANRLFSLPKHSLIVVDEAGMIGNDDYREFLSVAATHNYDIMLSCDDRQ